MNFEFEYNAEERKRLDGLNLSHVVGPGKFAILWCCCFLPTTLCLIALQMWSIVLAGGFFVLMASLVPLISKFRGAARHEFPRSIEFTPVGKKEICGDSTSFVKWNCIDEILETNDDFLISRNQRYSLLPKRVIGEENLQTVRDNLATWRNEPEGATEPIEMYRRLFGNSDTHTWEFDLQRDDLVAAAKSTSIRPVNDDNFSFNSIVAAGRSYRWFKILIFGLMVKLGFVLIFASLPPNGLSWGPLVVFLCLNPFVLLVAVGLWIRWQGIKGVPRFSKEHHHVRLFDGGWAIGNEDLVGFNKWNERSIFYLAKSFIGIRTDLSLIHVIPMRAFDGQDGLWQFLDRAIRLKKGWLRQKTATPAVTETVEPVDNVDIAGQPVNPYQSPSVNLR